MSGSLRGPFGDLRLVVARGGLSEEMLSPLRSQGLRARRWGICRTFQAQRNCLWQERTKIGGVARRAVCLG